MQEKIDYTDLDAAIGAAIVSTPKAKAAEIQSQVETLAKVAVPDGTVMRTVDRRLQALRKRGVIKFDPKDRCWLTGDKAVK